MDTDSKYQEEFSRLRHALDDIQTVDKQLQDRYISPGQAESDTVRSLKTIDNVIEKLMDTTPSYSRATMLTLALADHIRSWAHAQRNESSRTYVLYNVFKATGRISKLNQYKLRLFKTTLSLSISAVCPIQKTVHFLESTVPILMSMSIDHCINVVQSLTDDFISVNNDVSASLIDAGKKCSKFAVILTSIVLNPMFTELKYSGNDVVLRQWLTIIVTWMSSANDIPTGLSSAVPHTNWLFSALVWKVNSRSNVTGQQNGLSLVPIYEILRFIVIFEIKLDRTREGIAQLTHCLLTSIRSAQSTLKRNAQPPSIRTSPSSQYDAYLPLVTSQQFEKILGEMVNNPESRNSMNRLAQVTAVALAQGPNVIMPSSVRQSSKKLPWTSTTLLEIVTSST